MTPEEITNTKFIEKFKHKYTNRVRFHEVDSFGIVHNIQYFYYLEIAHIEYFRAIGIEPKTSLFSRDFLLITVHHEIDYFSPLKLDNIYSVLSRTSYIKNSSLELQSIIFNELDELISFGKTILVHLNPKSFEPEPLPKRIVELIRSFEGEYVEQLFNLNG